MDIPIKPKALQGALSIPLPKTIMDAEGLMSKNIVRVQMEMIKPGYSAVGNMIHFYTRPPKRFLWYPRLPEYSILENGTVMEFHEGGILFSFVAIGDQCDGLTWGDLDFLMTLKSLEQLYGQDLPFFADLAERQWPQALKAHSLLAVLALYDVDMAKQRITFDSTLTFQDATEEAVEAAKEAPSG
jgi:hypothetical protein